MALRPYNKVRHEVRYWLLRRLPTCKDIAPLMSESMERRLNLRERVVLRLHLWVCVWCDWYLQHLYLMRATLRRSDENLDVEASLPRAADDDTPVSLSVEARERIKRVLEVKNQ
jgi:hypothetical protein